MHTAVSCTILLYVTISVNKIRKKRGILLGKLKEKKRHMELDKDQNPDT